MRTSSEPHSSLCCYSHGNNYSSPPPSLSLPHKTLSFIEDGSRTGRERETEAVCRGGRWGRNRIRSIAGSSTALWSWGWWWYWLPICWTTRRSRMSLPPRTSFLGWIRLNFAPMIGLIIGTALESRECSKKAQSVCRESQTMKYLCLKMNRFLYRWGAIKYCDKITLHNLD